MAQCKFIWDILTGHKTVFLELSECKHQRHLELEDFHSTHLEP